MSIKVAARLHPFSHEPGFCCPLPGTTYFAQVFPMRILLHPFGPGKKVEIPLDGPLEGFTVGLDLEKGHVEVFGRGKKFIRYRIDPRQHGIEVDEKKPSGERLSLGCHKSQEWEMIRRRLDMAEIFPFWMKMASWIPEKNLVPVKGGTAELLPSPELFFRSAFTQCFIPHSEDLNHLGYVKGKGSGSPLWLLKESGKRIRSLFIEERGNEVYLLPKLPPEFHAGKFVSIQLTPKLTLDFEWSKKQLRRAELRGEGNLRLILPKGVASIRLQGKRVGGPLDLSVEGTLMLDQVQK